MEVINNIALPKAYQNTTRAFDVEGLITKKDGKNITIETEIEGKAVEFELRLKDEIVEEVGDKIEVKKEEIVRINVKREEREDLSPEAKERIRQVLGELGLELTRENVRLVGEYIALGLNPNKMDILSFLQSREALISLQEDLDVEMIVKMKLRGIDLERENLVSLSEKKLAIINEGEKKSILQILGFKKDLDYNEAEEISKEIYGRKMGRDVYDAIIALDKNGIEINRKSIDRVLEVLSKVKDLKDVDTSIIIRKEKDFTINALYREKNSYIKGEMAKGEGAKVFEEKLFIKDTDLEGAKNLLKAIGQEETRENIEIARAFIMEDTRLTEGSFANIKDMRRALERLVKDLKAEAVSALYDEDLLNTDIRELSEKIDKIIKPIEMPDIEDRPRESSLDIRKLDKIDTRLLLKIVNSQEDFTIDALARKLDLDKDPLSTVKEPDTSFEAVHRISEMFANIGEEPSSKAIALTYQREDRVTIQALSDSSLEVERDPNLLIKPVEESKEIFARTEYLKARALIRTSVVKVSVKENINLEGMEISKMNSYALSKLKAYEEALSIRDNLNALKGREKLLISMMRTNDLDLNLKEALSISKFLSNDFRGQRKNDKIREIERELSASIKKASGVKEAYIKLLNEFENSSDTSGQAKEDLDMRKKLSRRSTSLKLPVEIAGEMNNLNVFMPKSLDKNMMKLFLSIETREYGLVNMDLSLSGKNIRLKLDGGGDELYQRIPQLKEILQEKGYYLLEVER